MHGWETRMLLKYYLERGVSKAELSRRFGGESPDDPRVGRDGSVGPGPVVRWLAHCLVSCVSYWSAGSRLLSVRRHPRSPTSQRRRRRVERRVLKHRRSIPTTTFTEDRGLRRVVRQLRLPLIRRLQQTLPRLHRMTHHPHRKPTHRFETRNIGKNASRRRATTSGDPN